MIVLQIQINEGVRFIKAEGEAPRVASARPEGSSDAALAPRELAQLRASVAGVHARAARRARQRR